MLAGMLADFGSTVNRFPGVAGDGLLAPPSTSTYCPRAPAVKSIISLNTSERKSFANI